MIAEYGVGANAFFRSEALRAGNHAERGVGVGETQAQAARACFLLRFRILLAAFDNEIVQAQTLDQTQRFAPAAFTDALHGDNRADAENQTEQGQQGAQPAPPEFLDRLAPDG